MVRNVGGTILQQNLPPQALGFLVTLLHQEQEEDIRELLPLIPVIESLILCLNVLRLSDEVVREALPSILHCLS
jgi:hypothetical protein